MHTPVLLKEAIKALNVTKGKKYIDATFGEGGHALEILKLGGEVLGIDWDEENVKRKTEVGRRRPEGRALPGGWKWDVGENAERLKIVWGNYADIAKIAKKHQFVPVAGIICDLGLSMEQIGASGRGFSYKARSEPLDMRISQKDLDTTAGDLVNSLSQNDLYEVFSTGAEELSAWGIAESTIRTRRLKEIKTVGDLVSVIESVDSLSDREGTLRRVFQALRIAVNHEFENIRHFLEGSVSITTKGGKVVIITFHSLEDRIVKNYIRENGLKTNKKVVTAHPRAVFERSAKLREIIV